VTRPATASDGSRPLRAALCALAVAASAVAPALSAAPAPPTAAAVLEDLRSFREYGSVLYVAAHPDDENTQLITYLARGRRYRTAYLSLTRGDGGQNILGPEFGDLLGVIRTQELLAARRVDGGRQFFSRARDFGYSKDYRATLTKWDHQEVLSDIVRVIRLFRPDVIITRFPPEPSGTHGHHTASSALALEAFRLSGDPAAFPDQVPLLGTWQAKRIVWNGYGRFPGAPAPPAGAGTVTFGIDGTDPVTGASFAVLAARSRSMHKTQGFANFSVAAAGSGPRSESFHLLAGAPMKDDIMDGVDTSWDRVPGGSEVGRLAGEAIGHFNPASPAESVPALLELRKRLAALGPDPVIREKGRQLDRILQACLGLSVETTAPLHEVVPGESLTLRSTVSEASSVPVTWVGIRYPGAGPAVTLSTELKPGEASEHVATTALPPGTPLSQPYWLRAEGTSGMFRVDDPKMIGLPENPASVPIEYVFEVGGQSLTIEDEAVQIVSDQQRGRRRLDVIPPASVSFASSVELFAPGTRRQVTVDVRASRADLSGTVGLDAPQGWESSPGSQPFRLARAGDHARLTFTVTAPRSAETGSFGAHARVGGGTYRTERIEIDYGHIPPQLLQPPARFKAVSLDLRIGGSRVGYLPGAGDSVGASLELMGYHVTELTGDDLTEEGLKGLDAVVIGVRAFNTREDLPAHMPALLAYVDAGGTVVEQYNTPGGLKTPQLGPYGFKIDRDLPRFRVTDEKGPVEILDPASPVFTTPNLIGPADFGGWVQERGLDFASVWDPHWEPLIACSDAGEAPLKGGLLVAHYGKGYFVYTGLSFFRQLPAGVPGAYRLFANLVSLGK
jgi:LmbE family N-acetylglucosaminyl deacetylase